MKLLILAGGSGTRLWPLSRASHPKQVQPFFDDKTLLQHTWARLRRGFKARDIFVSTNASQVKLVRRQLPQLLSTNIFVEPVGRNTGPAIGFAATVFALHYPHEVVATVNSDHHIANEARFISTLRAGERTVRDQRGSITLLGIRPKYAETGYGYIEAGARAGKTAARRVVRFAEKPSSSTAKRYLRSNNYYWNSGLFMFYPQALLLLMMKHAPQLARGLQLLTPRSMRGPWVAGSAFSKLPAVSLDYAVLERTRKLVVLPADFGWTDVGHWSSVYDILAKKSGATVARGTYLGVDSSGNLVHTPAGKLVATLGVHDLVIIDTGDALLVCPRTAAQDVRKLVSRLRHERTLSKYV